MNPKPFNSLIINCILIYFFVISCSKQEATTNAEYGNVLFYTNAQYALNCGIFDVNIYIDDSFQGAINIPYLSIYKPPCESIDTAGLLKITIEKGTHNYYADYCCSDPPKRVTGQFTIEQDSCVLIFQDVYKAHENE